MRVTEIRSYLLSTLILIHFIILDVIISLHCRFSLLDVFCLRQGRDFVLLHPEEVEGGREAAGHRHVDHHHLPAELVVVQELGHANNHILTKYKYAISQQDFTMITVPGGTFSILNESTCYPIHKNLGGDNLPPPLSNRVRHFANQALKHHW